MDNSGVQTQKQQNSDVLIAKRPMRSFCAEQQQKQKNEREISRNVSSRSVCDRIRDIHNGVDFV